MRSAASSAGKRPATESALRAETIVGKRVELQLFTTLKCNLKCSYCSLGVGGVLRSQKHASYSVAELERFIDTHCAGKEVYFTLYGGEPALNPKFILELVERFPGRRLNCSRTARCSSASRTRCCAGCRTS